MEPFRRRRGRLRPLSVAPMMGRTDRHFRYFLRGITRCTLLYTEMVPVRAALEGRRHLRFHPRERPLALQLGGDDPALLAAAARRAEELGYDEINLNAGCPSDRVQQGRFGACLMRDPGRVAEAVAAMRGATALPVTVKHRIGVDELDRREDLRRFVERVAEAGCDRFIVHARKAWLSGLSPKENRDVPPLRHAEVHRLKHELPHLAIEINGGIRTLADAARHLELLDGVMIGRAACDDPFALAAADALLFGEAPPAATRRQVILGLLPYIEEELAAGTPVRSLTRPLLGLFHGCPGARRWKQRLSGGSTGRQAGPEAVIGTLSELPAAVLDAPLAPVVGTAEALSA